VVEDAGPDVGISFRVDLEEIAKSGRTAGVYLCRESNDFDLLPVQQTSLPLPTASSGLQSVVLVVPTTGTISCAHGSQFPFIISHTDIITGLVLCIQRRHRPEESNSQIAVCLG
jgi:hypothetical protein